MTRTLSSLTFSSFEAHSFIQTVGVLARTAGDGIPLRSNFLRFTPPSSVIASGESSREAQTTLSTDTYGHRWSLGKWINRRTRSAVLLHVESRLDDVRRWARWAGV